MARTILHAPPPQSRPNPHFQQNCFRVRKRPDAACPECYIHLVPLDPDICYRAVRARDRRFDGTFFVGVRTTGVYCRPICPARQPARERCLFFARAAEAERAGFRACFRCRPELAPGRSHVDAKSRLVRAAAARIEAGYLNEHSVEALAGELGVSGRHLRRAMEAELGASPVELAQTQRLSLATRLLRDTDMSLAEVAHAAGFGSVRRFNALFSRRVGRAPSALRQRRGAVRRPASAASPASIELRLDYRPPFDWQALLEFLAGRAIPGVECVEAGRYLRTVRVGDHVGIIAVQPDESRPALSATVSVSLAPVISQIVPRLRALFDLDARPDVIAEHLSGDPALALAARVRPGLRVPGSFDGFELGVRAVLGQQVSVKGATTLSGRFATRWGQPFVPGQPHGDPEPAREGARAAAGEADSESETSGLRLFPRAAEIAAQSVDAIRAVGLPRARAETIQAFARAVDRGRVELSVGAEPERAMSALQALPGIGPWTAAYIAMRGLGWPDAFPAGDLGLRKALGARSAAEVLRRANPWRPWRAYAAMHLWTGTGGG